MTPLERVKLALLLREPDMVPAVPIVGFHSAIKAKLPISKALENGKVMARLQLNALEEYGCDGVFTFMDLAAEPEALGCKTRFSDKGVPMGTEPVLCDPGDVGSLKMPELHKSKRLAPFLDAVRIMRGEVGDEYMVSGYVSGPMTLAGNVAGIVNLLKALIRRPEVAAKLLEFCTEFAIEYGRTLESHGAHSIAILEPSAASSMISPRQFQLFSLPYLQKIIKSLKVPVILHICGDTTLSLEKMAESGAKALSLGKVDLAEAKKKIGNKVCLMGNVPTIEILLRGTIEQVRVASKECIKNAGEGGGFILSSGCDIPADTPSDNIKAMVRAARDEGKYPLRL